MNKTRRFALVFFSLLFAAFCVFSITACACSKQDENKQSESQNGSALIDDSDVSVTDSSTEAGEDSSYSAPQSSSDEPESDKPKTETDILETEMEEQYFVGDRVEIKPAKLIYATGFINSTSHRITFPDGTTSSSDEITFNAIGNYTIRFSVELYSEVLVAEMQFSVNEWDDSFSDISVKSIDCEETLFVGNPFVAPETATLDYFGREVTGSFVSLTYPDGNVSTELKNNITSRGNYVLTYKYEKYGRSFIAKKTLGTNSIRYTIQGDRSTAEYDFDKITLSLAKDEVFSSNQVIDLNALTEKDYLIAFTLDPERSSEGLPDAKKINIRLTDIYDPENYVTVQLNKRFDEPDYRSWADGQSYLYAGGAKQTLAGLFGGENRTTGYKAKYSMVANPANQVMGIKFDYAKRQFSTNCEFGEGPLFADLDDPANYTGMSDVSTVLWNGFTTGECYISIFAEDYYSTDKLVRIKIVSLAGLDLVDMEKATLLGRQDTLVVGKGESVDLSSETIVFDGKQYSATLEYLTDPDGVVLSGNGFVAEKLGVYKAYFSADTDSEECYALLNVNVMFNEILVTAPLFDVYPVNAPFTAPSAVLTSFGEESATDLTVIKPDNTVVNKKSFILDAEGVWKLVYSAEKGGKNYSKTVELNVSSSVPYFYGENANTYAYSDTTNPDYINQSMCGIRIAAGDVATLCRYVDITSERDVLFAPYFLNMTKAQYYAAFPVTITLYNAENVNEYITIVITAESWMSGDVQWDQLYFSMSYCGGAAVTNSRSMHIGSGSAEFQSILIWIQKNAEDGIDIGTGTTKTIAGANFTKAIMTIKANAALDITSVYVGDKRDWKAVGGRLYGLFDYKKVSFYDGETLLATEIVNYNDKVSYKGVTPTSPDGYAFAGWFIKGSNTPFDFSTPITNDISLYAGYSTPAFAYGKPVFAQYATGDILDLGNVTLSYSGETCSADCVVYDPDGNAVEKGASGYTLSKEGSYRVVLSATLGGKKYSEERTVKCAAKVAYFSGNDDDTYAHTSTHSDYGATTMCGIHIAEGDVATYNEYIDWTGEKKVLFGQAFNIMTRDEYHAAFPITITLYNADNANEYIKITITSNKWKAGEVDWDHLRYSISYCDNEPVVKETDMHIGNDSTSLFTQLIWIQNDGNGGTVININEDRTVAANFTKAIMTIESSAELDLTSIYVCSKRDWVADGDRLYQP